MLASHPIQIPVRVPHNAKTPFKNIPSIARAKNQSSIAIVNKANEQHSYGEEEKGGQSVPKIQK